MNGNRPEIEQINAEEMRNYSNFEGQIKSGAIFDEFLGLWALGMDLLPSKGDEEIKIYVNRSCDCSMKVWVKIGIKLNKLFIFKLIFLVFDGFIPTK